MSSYFTTTTTVTTTTALPPTITLPEILTILHDPALMLTINPLLKSATPLPTPSIHAFYKTVPTSLKPSSATSIEQIPVFSVVEAASPSSSSQGTAPGEEQEQNTWRGTWSKRFIPDELTYETSMQHTPSGMFAITHAPLGVHSVTTWTVTHNKNGDGFVLEKEGKVTSNRMLMGFIRTTLQESYDRLARDFVVLLQREVGKKRERGKGEKEKEKEKVIVEQPAAEELVEAVTVT